MYGQGQLAERNFFFEMLKSAVQKSTTANSEIVINQRLDPCLVKLGLLAGSFRSKMPNFFKFCVDKNGIKHLLGLSGVLLVPRSKIVVIDGAVSELYFDTPTGPTNGNQKSISYKYY